MISITKPTKKVYYPSMNKKEGIIHKQGEISKVFYLCGEYWYLPPSGIIEKLHHGSWKSIQLVETNIDISSKISDYKPVHCNDYFSWKVCSVLFFKKEKTYKIIDFTPNSIKLFI